MIAKQDPENFIVLTQLAILYFLDYKDTQTANLLRMALSIKHNHIPALFTMAELFKSTGYPEKAKALYTLILFLDARQLSVEKSLAKLNIEIEENEEAFSSFERATRL